MKKGYLFIMAIIAIIAILSVSSASAGLFDMGTNVEFENLKMNAPNGDVYDDFVDWGDYEIELFVLNESSDDERISQLATSLDPSSSDVFSESSLKNAFENSESSIANVVHYSYDDDSSVPRCAKTVTGLDKISDFKEFEVDGHEAAEVIVSDSVLVDKSGTLYSIPSEADGATSATDLSKWIFVNDDGEIYAIHITSSVFDTLNDKSLLQTSEIQDAVDSITLS